MFLKSYKGSYCDLRNIPYRLRAFGRSGCTPYRMQLLAVPGEKHRDPSHKDQLVGILTFFMFSHSRPWDPVNTAESNGNCQKPSSLPAFYERSLYVRLGELNNRVPL